MNIPCICPPKGDAVRHPDGDEITFRENIDFHGITTIRWAAAVVRQEDPLAPIAEVLATTTEHLVLFGIETWTAVDSKNKPVPVSKVAIRELILSNTNVGQMVGDEADRTYEAVMLPLLSPASMSSPPGPKTESTSPKTGSLTPPRRQSKRSSISTIPTAATEVTSNSLDGVSRSSQSSGTAA